MSDTTNVLLITGFLGSGKTTFLNRVIHAVPAGHKLLVLVNEFGDVGIDGALLHKAEQREDFTLVEISKGSIFCACVKADFIKALIRIAEEVRPDILIMEATGVANPGDLQKDLQLPVFKGRFRLKEQVCLLDCPNFGATHSVFVSIEKQMRSSTLFLVNKTDLADAAEIAAVKAAIRQFHPDPTIVETSHAHVPLDDLVRKLTDAGLMEGIVAGAKADAGAVMADIFADPFRQLDPPENLVSASRKRPGATPEQAAALLSALPAEVVRAKGFFGKGDEVFLVESIVGRVSISKSEPCPRDLLGSLVLIFPPESKDAVLAELNTWE